MNQSMHSHLSDDQIAAAFVEQDAGVKQSTEVDNHVRSCPACAAKLDDLRASLAGFGSLVRKNAERTDTFWWHRRATSPVSALPLTRWAMAAAAVVITATASITFIHKPEEKRPT